MLIGLESFSYHLAFHVGAMDVFGFLRRCRELDVEGAVLNVEGPSGRHLGGTSPKRVERVAALARELDLYLELDARGTDPESLGQMMRLCHALGGDTVRTYASCGGVLEGELERAARDLRRLVPRAEELGVKLGLENHEFEASEQILQVVEAVDSEWVGTHVDTGNSMMAWEDPLQAVAALAPQAVSSHFKDHVVIRGDDQPLVAGVTLGTGSLDCARIWRLLEENSPLERANIEVCWGYSAPFRRPQEQGTGARLGEGAFEVVEPPYAPEWIPEFALRPSNSYEWWRPLEEALAHQTEQLLQWEEASVLASVEYVQALRRATS